MTQEGLGNVMGVDRGTVIRIEAGKTSFLVDQAIKASLHLKVPLIWLFSDDWTRPDGVGDTPGPRRGEQGG